MFKFTPESIMEIQSQAESMLWDVKNKAGLYDPVNWDLDTPVDRAEYEQSINEEVARCESELRPVSCDEVQFEKVVLVRYKTESFVQQFPNYVNASKETIKRDNVFLIHGEVTGMPGHLLVQPLSNLNRSYNIIVAHDFDLELIPPDQL